MVLLGHSRRPWDTCETMRATAKFAASLPLDYAQFSNATPYPGTELATIVSREGRIVRSSGNIYGGVAFDMPGRFSAADVTRATRYAYARFYSTRPCSALRVAVNRVHSCLVRH